MIKGSMEIHIRWRARRTMNCDTEELLGSLGFLKVHFWCWSYAIFSKVKLVWEVSSIKLVDVQDALSHKQDWNIDDGKDWRDEDQHCETRYLESSLWYKLRAPKSCKTEENLAVLVVKWMEGFFMSYGHKKRFDAAKCQIKYV